MFECVQNSTDFLSASPPISSHTTVVFAHIPRWSYAYLVSRMPTSLKGSLRSTHLSQVRSSAKTVLSLFPWHLECLLSPEFVSYILLA